MSDIIAFSGSNSKTSINKQLVDFSTSFLTQYTFEVLDLNDYTMPMYGIDYEQKHGIPENTMLLINKIKASKGIIISLPEHNGNYTAFFKNMFDWMSRVQKSVWNDLPVLLMTTSPGGRGGASVLDIAKNSFPRMGATHIEVFSLPNFNENFKEGGIVNSDLKALLKIQVQRFETNIS